eukprot:TRINITY_DN4733_c0_g1_i2.p1 TRINITY_DN4733_c0_g1~~TRINITY_DN4733_c0_g1_i2.p1  ORF type:complete len:1708 (-),score=201.52 TRINITY_DN4733_c0_g1_i2:8-5131(-)
MAMPRPPSQRMTGEQFLELPAKLDFAFCPVKETSTLSFTLRNCSDKAVDFKWETESPFTISPATGHLPSKGTVKITVEFFPTEACAFVVSAICKYDAHDGRAQSCQRIKFGGVGKYPYIQAAEPEIDFGGVASGSTAERALTLVNRSSVRARVEVRQQDTDQENVFTITPLSKEILPEGSATFRVNFKPNSTGTYSCDSFQFCTVGGNTVTVQCSGQATGPEVSVSTHTLHFGDVEVGHKVSKTFTLLNHSHVPTEFQFLGVDPGCAFVFQPEQGLVPPCDKWHKGTAQITVTFQPNSQTTTAQLYYRRVFCLVHNQQGALQVDLVGGSFHPRDESRSAANRFSTSDADMHHARIMAGVAHLPPAEITRLLGSVVTGRNADGDDDITRERLVQTTQPRQLAPVQMVNEIFESVTNSTRLPFSLSDSTVSFGASAPRPTAAQRRAEATKGESNSYSPARTVVLRNNTSARATAVWCVADGPSNQPPFEVRPSVAELAPFSSETFRITFQPITPNTYYSHSLECYVSYKDGNVVQLPIAGSTRDTSGSEMVLPPFALSLHATGHTFGTVDHYVAEAGVNRNLVSFPACPPGATLHQTLLLTNRAETPLQFSVSLQQPGPVRGETPRDDRSQTSSNPGTPAIFTPPTFGCVPATGLVPAGGVQVLVLRFQPRDPVQYRGAARITLNGSSYGTLNVSLVGQSFLPRLTLAEDGCLFFKPTQVGSTSHRVYTLTNPSRISVAFQWQIPAAFEKVLTVDPVVGVIRGNGTAKVRFAFTPGKERKYQLRVPCFSYSTGSTGTGTTPTPAPSALAQHGEADNSDRVRATLTVVGEGTFGGISLEPLNLDFGSVLVGGSAQKQLTLYNTTPCDVRYRIRCVPNEEEPNGADGGSTDSTQNALESSHTEGALAARTHLVVNLLFKPKVRREYRISVLCHNPTFEEQLRSNGNSTPRIPVPSCEVTGVGVYPSLCIADIKSLRTSKAHLSEQFSVDPINRALNGEITQSDKDRLEYSVRRLTERLPAFVFDFSAGSEASYPAVVHLCLANMGKLPTQFSFRFPNDTDLTPEQWWPEEPLDEQAQHHELILDHRLFSIEPRDATVPPGGNANVRLTYQRKLPGLHKLPVLFSITGGKQITLMLTGRTLRTEERRLHFTSLQHTFLPRAIGEKDSPIEYFELRNPCWVPVRFRVDTAPLRALAAANHKFDVFQCEDIEGEVAPQGSVHLRWRFRPLESKEYLVQVPISVIGSETSSMASAREGNAYIVQLTGEGYHPRKVSQAALEEWRRQEFFPITPAPKILLPPAPLQFSEDVVRFGRVPYHSTVRRLVVLFNRSKSDTFSFTWQPELPHGSQKLIISPASGQLGPQEQVFCRMVLKTGHTSHIVDTDIRCEVMNISVRQKREKERGRREAQEEQNDAEEIFAMSINGTSWHSPDGAPMSIGELTLAGTNTMGGYTASSKVGKSPKSRAPVATLPPKLPRQMPKAQTGVLAVRAEPEMQAEEEHHTDTTAVWTDVQPLPLFLRIQARVMSMRAFQEAHPNEAARHFQPELLYQQHTLAQRAESAPHSGILLPADPGLAAFAAEFLEGLLREVIHDPEIQQVAQKLSIEAVPYFTDFAGDPKVRYPVELDRQPAPLEEEDGVVAAATATAPLVSAILPSTTLMNSEVSAIGETDEPSTSQSEKAEAEHEQWKVLQNAGFRCAVEDFLESLSYDIIRDLM